MGCAAREIEEVDGRFRRNRQGEQERSRFPVFQSRNHGVAGSGVYGAYKALCMLSDDNEI